MSIRVKHYFTLLLFTLLTSGSYSQLYTFTLASNPYSDLTDTTSVNNGTVWDDDQFKIPIGFYFEILGDTFDTITISEGLVTFGKDQAVAISVFGYALAGADLVDKGYGDSISMSPINYQLTGTSGSQILKIEWKNAGFYDDQVPYNDFINFQLWLYEANDDIEIHFGTNSVDTSSYYNAFGAIIGVSYYDPFFYIFINGVFLNGLASSPSLDTFLAAIVETPANSTVYRFSKNYNHTNHVLLRPDINVFLTNHSISINLDAGITSDKYRLELVKLNGQVITKIDLMPGENKIRTNYFLPGIYLIVISNKTHIVFTRKVLFNF